jgi:hypothetical protein
MQDSLNNEVEIATEAPTEISIEQLPLPVLRERLDAKGVVYKSTDKKKELVKALVSGESTIKPVEKKKAPTMADKIQKQPAALVSNDVLAKLKELEAEGLKWEIDEEFSCINFYGRIPTSANLDQSPNNILRTAREALAKGSRAPVEVSHTKDLY